MICLSWIKTMFQDLHGMSLVHSTCFIIHFLNRMSVTPVEFMCWHKYALRSAYKCRAHSFESYYILTSVWKYAVYTNILMIDPE
jgi:hypothetical protein